METVEKSKAFNVSGIIEYASGSIVSKVIAKQKGGNITLFAFDKGQELSEHTAPYDALVQVLEGEAEILINRQSHRLRQGEGIIMPANDPHAVKATGKFKMQLTMIKD
ncbi:MAG TPA: cupin domain-containing protein [Bacteroidales bacterium]|nr:cupin domain-containing protein [Bacteroidales bacterium]